MCSSLLSVLVVALFTLCYTQRRCLEDSANYQAKYVAPILTSLAAKNYTIHSGFLYWITDEAKHGGSPASSYGMWNISVSDSSLKPNPDAPMAMLFHPSDAIVFTGCTPPKATYFGFENYAYAKYGVNGSGSGGENDMNLVFSSHGAAINQYVVNVSDDYSSAPFDSITTIITTGDKATYNDIYQEYASASLQHTVNNLWIPQKYLRFTPYNFTKYNYTVRTYPGRIDSFMPVARIINHLEDVDWWNYVSYKQPVYWLTAERLRSEDAVNPREPFTELYTRNITSQRTELDLQVAFGTFVNDTIRHFEREYELKLVEQRTLVNYNIGPHYYGYNCYENNWNCQGDLRDEQYWGTHNGTNVVRRSVDLHPMGVYNLVNDYFLVMGVNHFSTNFTVFDNVIVYCNENRYSGLYEPIAITDNFEYNNSAVLADIDTDVDDVTLAKFYMTQTARPELCHGKNIPRMCFDEEAVGTDNKIAFYTRNLLNLETLTRPPQSAILPDILLHFKVSKIL